MNPGALPPECADDVIAELAGPVETTRPRDARLAPFARPGERIVIEAISVHSWRSGLALRTVRVARPGWTGTFAMRREDDLAIVEGASGAWIAVLRTRDAMAWLGADGAPFRLSKEVLDRVAAELRRRAGPYLEWAGRPPEAAVVQERGWASRTVKSLTGAACVALPLRFLESTDWEHSIVLPLGAFTLVFAGLGAGIRVRRVEISPEGFSWKQGLRTYRLAWHEVKYVELLAPPPPPKRAPDRVRIVWTADGGPPAPTPEAQPAHAALARRCDPARPAEVKVDLWARYKLSLFSQRGFLDEAALRALAAQAVAHAVPLR